jgi:hypothetical protein
MKTAILISLDYEHFPYEACKAVWAQILDKMQKAGFTYNGRLFTIDLAGDDQAYLRARATIDSIEAHLPEEERHLHEYLRDFYGFKYEDLRNLLTPCARFIEVREIETNDPSPPPVSGPNILKLTRRAC